MGVGVRKRLEGELPVEAAENAEERREVKIRLSKDRELAILLSCLTLTPTHNAHFPRKGEGASFGRVLDDVRGGDCYMTFDLFHRIRTADLWRECRFGPSTSQVTLWDE